MVDLNWTPRALIGLFAWLLSWGAAALIFSTAPGRTQNRLLALALFFEGTMVGAYFFVGYLWAPDPMTRAAIRGVEFAAHVPAGLCYLAFLGTIAAPLSRPLARPAVRRALVAGALVYPVVWLWLSGYALEPFVVPVPTPEGFFWVRARTGVGDILELFTLVVLLFGFAVAWSAHRAARPGTANRARARAYLWAFGVRDAVWVSLYLMFLSALIFGWYHPLAPYAFDLLAVSQAAFVLLLGYGILRHQLFDIELKIKRTVKQGTVVAVLAAAYITTSLGARAFMSTDAAQTTGVVLTGLLLFGLVPLQRFGGRMADAAMPGVRDDEAYLDQRRIEVYRAALEDAMRPDGAIQAGHEARLEGLRGRLGLTDRDHALLLHAVRTPEHTTIAPTFEPGRTVLGRYKIEAVLGEGGQGTTYKALDTTLGREVVLKALHGPDPKRLLKEARALAAIQHPNVVSIHDVERVGDHVYIVMEHVDGGSLKERLQAGALDGEGFQGTAEDLLAGLQAIHEAGLIHRDIKPSNVLLTLDGTAKLADLGIATTSEPSDQTTLGAGSTNARGTIAYMSPEQARGDKLTPASDLFSAALTLYEAYTGRPLFKPRPGESPVELQARVAGWDGFQEELGDRELDAWFKKALSPDPEARFRGSSSMLRALTTWDRASPQAK